jgi:hypothetical protein
VSAGEGVQAACSAAGREVEALQGALAAAQGSLRAALLDKARAVEWGGACERMLARFLALEAGRLPSVGGGGADGAAVRARLREAEAAVAAVGSLCEALQAQHWELSEAIGRVRELALQPTVAKLAAVSCEGG